jgi:ribonuclease HI
MELTASYEALNYIYQNDKHALIELYTDSNYVKEGITKWITNWKKNNWKTASKQDVKNKDLWIKLDNMNTNLNVNWNWVKAHADNEMNNRVDQIANDQVF